MPELPELTVVCEVLDGRIRGQTIVSAEDAVVGLRALPMAP